MEQLEAPEVSTGHRVAPAPMHGFEGELRQRVRIRREWQESPAAAEATDGPPTVLPAGDRGSQPLRVGFRKPERPLRTRAHVPRADIEGVDLGRRRRVVKPSGPARGLCAEGKPPLLVRTGQRAGRGGAPSGCGEAAFGAARRGPAPGLPLPDRHSVWLGCILSRAGLGGCQREVAAKAADLHSIHPIHNLKALGARSGERALRAQSRAVWEQKNRAFRNPSHAIDSAAPRCGVFSVRLFMACSPLNRLGVEQGHPVGVRRRKGRKQRTSGELPASAQDAPIARQRLRTATPRAGLWIRPAAPLSRQGSAGKRRDVDSVDGKQL